MEVNENNDAPVLNVEESQAGDGLVENAGNDQPTNEQESQQVNESQANETEEEIEAFDPAAFAAPENNLEDNSESESESVESNEEDDTPAWPDLQDDSDNNSSDQGNTTEPENSTSDNTETSEQQGANIDQVQFELFTKKLGLEAKNIDEVKEAIDHIVQENNKLKEAAIPHQTNKKIEDLENFSKLDDEALVRKSFEADGLEGEKLDHTIDRLLDSGMIDVEALKIRNNIDRAIQSERQSIKQVEESENAKRKEEHQQAVESFGNYMQSIDTLFDFKLTGNPEKLPEVRKNHTEYVTSGKYLNEITATEAALAESSWLWRNRAVLKNALINNGRQNGRREILDQIGKPETNKPQRFVTPDNGEFDPKKFMQG